MDVEREVMCAIPASCDFAFLTHIFVVWIVLKVHSNEFPFILLVVIDACRLQHPKVLLSSNSGHMLIILKEKKKTWVLGKEARDNYMLNYQDPTTSKYYCLKLIANMGQGIILRAFRWYQRLTTLETRSEWVLTRSKYGETKTISIISSQSCGPA